MNLVEFKTRINKLKDLKQCIENSVYNGEYDKAKTLLKDYENIFGSDISLATIKSAIYVGENRLNEAEDILLDVVKDLPFNYEINYNLGMVYAFKGEFNKSLEFYFKSAKYNNTEEQANMSIKAINELLNFIQDECPQQINEFKQKLNEFKEWLKETDARSFPLDSKGNSLIGRFINMDSLKEGHYLNLYKIEDYIDIVPQLKTLYKTEMLHGKIVDNIIEIDINDDVIVPISTRKISDISIKINDKYFQLTKIIPNTFRYLPIREKGKLTIKSTEKFFVGDIIKIKDKISEDKPRLIMYLFLDGLSQKTIKDEKVQQLMPNVYKFFKNGLRFNNCYCNSEWTLPGLATFFTGEYTTNHRLFHSEFTYELGSKEKLMSEIFKKGGYFTTQICNDWRKTPLYGYNKGFDRTVFQPAIDGLGCEEVIMEIIEHLQAFDEKNNFMWVSFGDLHKVPDNIDGKISSQVKGSLYSRTSKSDNNETVFKNYDDKKIERYEMEVKRLDFYLGILFDYINSKYSNDEILIYLVSDHGQTFLNKDDFYLHEGRTRVPLFITGKNVPNKNIDDIVENVDTLPMAIKFSNINYNFNKDGKIPKCLGGEYEREFAYTESIFKGQTYKAVINDCIHRFMFQSENFVENDGRVELGDFKINLINKETGMDEKDKFNDKIEKYLDVVFEHIKKNIKI